MAETVDYFLRHTGTELDAGIDNANTALSKANTNAINISGLQSEATAKWVTLNEVDTRSRNNANNITLLQEDNARLNNIINNELTLSVTGTSEIVELSGLAGGLWLDVKARAIATQEGTGDSSPDNVRKIVGTDSVDVVRSGRNIGDDTLLKASGTLQADGTYLVSGSKNSSLLGKSLFTNYALYDGAITISFIARFSAATESTGLRLKVHYTDGTYQNVGVVASTIVNTSVAYTTSSSKTVSRIAYDYGVTTIDTYMSGIMIQLGSTATEYEPFSGGTFSIALPETVYGLAEAEATVDLSNRAVTDPTVYYEFDGTETWVSTGSNNRFRLSNLARRQGVYTTATGHMSHFTYNANVYGDALDNVGYMVTGTDLYIRFGSASTITTVAQLKTWFAAQKATGTPVQLVYQIAEPKIITINPVAIPSLSGTNTVYTNTGGQTTVTGRQGLPGAIQNLTNAVIALGGNI